MHVEESNIKTIDIELIKLRSIYYISLLAMSLRYSFEIFIELDTPMKRFKYIKLGACDGNCLFFICQNQIINKRSMY